MSENKDPLTPGKRFEKDWSDSVPKTCFLYRFKDSATSFKKVKGVNFTPSNICDFLLIDDISRTTYFLELKTTKGSSIPLKNIREEQIKQLTEASMHNVIAGLVINFREKKNYTVFVDIGTLNRMMKEIDKKSFSIVDFTKYGCVSINSKIARVHYRYNIESFVKKVHR